jgi:hypothetical protein
MIAVAFGRDPWDAQRTIRAAMQLAGAATL